MNPGENHFPQRKQLPHLPPPWVGASAVFFVTINCRPRGANQLCIEPVASSLRESVLFRQARGDWHVHLWLLMPDHMHALLSFPLETDLRKVIANWKEHTAKRAGVVWQRDFFDHRIRSHESLQQKADYIRQNPVRKGLVGLAADWEFVWAPT